MEKRPITQARIKEVVDEYLQKSNRDIANKRYYMIIGSEWNGWFKLVTEEEIDSYSTIVVPPEILEILRLNYVNSVGFHVNYLTKEDICTKVYEWAQAYYYGKKKYFRM